ncbi:mitochondrial fission factor homolog B isoform X2 [Corvus cornix cornix]|uniref:mitochondrial fission factor homolog B isoform X2 n=1 Tax=Corvus cornix cornix TaxID=932674 RepID=UPI00194EE04B|nr:mitochondrial fission factor homolog B isoform X2 [Corvus cornix cornix]
MSPPGGRGTPPPRALPPRGSAPAVPGAIPGAAGSPRAGLVSEPAPHPFPSLLFLGSCSGFTGPLRTSAKMWPLWGLDVNRVRCDLLFTEAINQRMQVPNRLKVAESCSPGDRKTRTEDVPPSFRMHIPDRISLAEISDTSLRPVLLTQPRKVPSVVVHVSPDPSGDLPFLPSASRASAQRRKRSGHHSSKSRRDRTPSDCAQLALHSPGQHHEGSQEPILAAESALEEAGVTEVAAMRRQLVRISGRLRVLEEQCHAWRQKEALVYSVMISACLINTWLWLRR